MRIAVSLLVFGAVSAVSVPCGAAQPAPAGTCPEIVRPKPPENAARTANALGLLASVTQLSSRLGTPVLTTNLATSVAINNQAGPALRAQAVSDALITSENANTLADGLGATMAKIYSDKASFSSKDDGAHPHCGEIGPAVTALITSANAISADDSGAGKVGYADGKKGLFPLPPNGTYDMIGKAYGHRAGSLGAGSLGNARPFQTAPIWSSAVPRIETYDGRDFFKVETNSRLLLMGPTAADTAQGRTGSDLTNSPSFPSGHTTFGYTEALVLAMMVPERYRALAYRGSEYGHSRIVLGAHYPVDIIGGRTLATYDLAQNLAGRPGYAQVAGHTFRSALAAAAVELRDYLQKNGCPNIATCAARDPIVRADNASVFVSGAAKPSSTGDAYAFRLNYGLASLGPTDLPPEPVPVEASTLLETRFPYLTDAQRLDVLRTTQGPSGHFLDVSPLNGMPLTGAAKSEAEVGAYSRLNLYAAAGGYASFADQIVVDQEPSGIADPDLQPFLDLARADVWSNDIGGTGGLTKKGSGTLVLSGANTYSGPTVVAGGTLEIAGSVTSATRVEAGGILAGAGKVHDVSVAPGGKLSPGAGAGALDIDGALVLQTGAALVVQADSSGAKIDGKAKIDGAHLVINASAAARPGVPLAILAARGGVSGTFADVSVDVPSLLPRLTYGSDAVYLTLEAKSAAPAN